MGSGNIAVTTSLDVGYYYLSESMNEVIYVSSTTTYGDTYSVITSPYSSCQGACAQM